MKKLLPTIAIGLVLSACNQADQKKEGLIDLWRADTLTLFAEYDECGEWGGHRETFKIFKDNREALWTKYKKDTLLSCDPYQGRNRKIVKEQTIQLTDEDQNQIVAYMHDLLDRTLEKTIPSHSGDYFRIYTTDSTIVISRTVPGYLKFDQLRSSIMK